MHVFTAGAICIVGCMRSISHRRVSSTVRSVYSLDHFLLFVFFLENFQGFTFLDNIYLFIYFFYSCFSLHFVLFLLV